MPRPLNTNRSTKMVYIFHEGKETERKYFLAIKTLFRIPNLEIKPIALGSGSILKNIRKLNEKIAQTVSERSVRGVTFKRQIFLVFDVDILTQVDLDALYKGILPGVNLIPTNQMFEYWILLHFEKPNRLLRKSEYISEIKRFITPKNDKFSHQDDMLWLTNSPSTGIKLVNKAIENCAIINSTHRGKVAIKKMDPYSKVGDLIMAIKNA